MATVEAHQTNSAKSAGPMYAVMTGSYQVGSRWLLAGGTWATVGRV